MLNVLKINASYREKAGCLLSITKDLDSLRVRFLSWDADPLRAQHTHGRFCIVSMGLGGQALSDTNMELTLLAMLS